MKNSSPTLSAGEGGSFNRISCATLAPISPEIVLDPAFSLSELFSSFGSPPRFVAGRDPPGINLGISLADGGWARRSLRVSGAGALAVPFRQEGRLPRHVQAGPDGALPPQRLKASCPLCR